MSRIVTLALILSLGFSTLMVIQAASASSPQVPQFTIQLVSHPYDVPAVTSASIDKYTGKEIVTTTPGYHVENKSIEVTITNQQVAPNTDNQNHTDSIYYNIRVKGHFAENWEWKELFSPCEIQNAREGISWCANPSPIQSSSEKTVIACSADYPEDAKIDFQVQALYGYFTKYYPIIADAYGWYFSGEASDWSSTQTIAMGSGEVTVSQSPVTPSPTPVQPTPTSVVTAEPTQNPTETPRQPNTQSEVTTGTAWEEIALAVTCSIIVVLAIALALLWRKRA